MGKQQFTVRNAHTSEFDALGKLMVDVYSKLDGFPKPNEQPTYYNLLLNIGDFTKTEGTELLVAVTDADVLLGGVVYFDNMLHYGSGGTATQEKDAAGFRLLAVDVNSRGLGVGKILTETCVQKAKDAGLSQVIIHSTKVMQTAWDMYLQMGFRKSEDLDFLQGELPVFGFRLLL